MPRTQRPVNVVSSLADGISDRSGATNISASTAVIGGAPLRPRLKAVADRVAPRRVALYLPVRLKFTLTLLIAVSWAALSYHLAGRWIADLTELAGGAFAYCAIFSIAIIPGFMNAFLATGLLLALPPYN